MLVRSPIRSPIRSVIYDPTVGKWGAVESEQSLKDQVLALSPIDMFDYTDAANLWQNSDRTGTVTSASDPVGYVDNLGSGSDETQSTGVSRPLFGTSGGNHISFNGVNHYMSGTLSLGAGEMYVGLQTTDTTWMFFSNGGSSSPFVLTAQDGAPQSINTGIGSPSTYVNRVALSAETRDALHDAVTSASGKVISLLGADFTSLTTPNISGYGGSFNLSGKLFRRATFSGALSAANRAIVEDWIAEGGGITL